MENNPAPSQQVDQSSKTAIDPKTNAIFGQLPHEKSFNQPLKKQIIFVFIIATLGVFAAFGTFFILNQFSSQDLSEVEETLAWKPMISGVCQMGNISLGPESSEFDVVLTVTKDGQSQTLNFSSGPDKQLDENFQWPFTVANGDVISWSSKVTCSEGLVENHSNQYKVTGCASEPSPTTQSYSEPDYPACPANSQRLTVNGELANSSDSNTKTHTLSVTSAGKITSIIGTKKEGHPEEGCLSGPDNDNGKYPCDQGELNEGFSFKINGAPYGTVNDKGAGSDDQWFDFAITKDANLSTGNNTILVQHVGGDGIGSVDYKASICYTLNQASPSSTATATATASAKATATASATASPTASPTATGTPTSTPTSTPTASPATGGDGRSDGLGCAENDCSGNQVNRVEANKAVADAGTDNSTGRSSGTTSTLPDAGIPFGLVMLIIGGIFALLGLVLGKKSTYKK